MNRRVCMIAVATTLIVASCGEPDQKAAREPSSGNRNAPVRAAPAPGPDIERRLERPEGRRNRHLTKLTSTSCKLIEEIEETGDWVRTCRGVGGYSLQWSSGDLREELDVVIDGKPTALNLSSLVSNGSFDWLGKTVEWRGPEDGPPDVLVTRVHSSRQNGTGDGGSLAVARLRPSPCLVAIVRPGPNQSDRARAIADAKLPACLKG